MKGQDEAKPWLHSEAPVTAFFSSRFAGDHNCSESAIVQLKRPGFDQILKARDPGWVVYGYPSTESQL